MYTELSSSLLSLFFRLSSDVDEEGGPWKNSTETRGETDRREDLVKRERASLAYQDPLTTGQALLYTPHLVHTRHPPYSLPGQQIFSFCFFLFLFCSTSLDRSVLKKTRGPLEPREDSGKRERRKSRQKTYFLHKHITTICPCLRGVFLRAGSSRRREKLGKKKEKYFAPDLGTHEDDA